MEYRDFKAEFEIDTVLPSCANLATQEQPYLSILDVSERVYLTEAEIKGGIDGEAIDFMVWEESLYERLIAELANANVPEHLWPDAIRLELRWRFGRDKWAGQLARFAPYWIEAELVEKKS